jgi:hypothetical protein
MRRWWWWLWRCREVESETGNVNAVLFSLEVGRRSFPHSSRYPRRVTSWKLISNGVDTSCPSYTERRRPMVDL